MLEFLREDKNIISVFMNFGQGKSIIEKQTFLLSPFSDP